MKKKAVKTQLDRALERNIIALVEARRNASTWAILGDETKRAAFQARADALGKQRDELLLKKNGDLAG